MAAFDPRDESDQDYQLVRDGFVTLFRSETVLAATTAWLRAHGYQIVTIDAAGWSTQADLHRDVAAALDFPGYYGQNLDALNDCLRDVAAGTYGSDPAATGLVLVLRRYDRFAAAQPRIAHALLDVFCDRAREAALTGRRLMCLVQSDDPHLTIPAVGATPVGWSDAEWSDADRDR